MLSQALPAAEAEAPWFGPQWDQDSMLFTLKARAVPNRRCASRPEQRALLTPHTNPGSLYRRGNTLPIRSRLPAAAGGTFYC